MIEILLALSIVLNLHLILSGSDMIKGIWIMHEDVFDNPMPSLLERLCWWLKPKAIQDQATKENDND